MPSVLLQAAESFLRRKQFMETEGSIPHLQVPATCPYTEPEQFNPCFPIPLPEDPPMPLVFFISISHYLSAICSICSQLYHDIRSKYANFTTHFDEY
jgi:hypothetical protein